MRADVYHNLHRGLWSVRENGVVAFHTHHLLVSNAVFVVSEAGRQRVLRERRKNVHAVVRGDVGANSMWFAPLGYGDLRGWRRVTYDPYKGPTFVVRGSGRAVYGAEEVVFRPGRRCYARGLVYTPKEQP